MSALPKVFLQFIPLLAASAVATAQNPFFEIQGGPNEGLGTVLGDPIDITGDGRADYLIGSPLKSVSTGSDGMAAVHDGVTGLRLWHSNGNAVHAEFGTALASLSDINADGIPEVVVGAPGQVNGAGTDTGMVAVVSGAFIRTGSGMQFLWKSFGAAHDDFFGTAIGNVGDVTGDGFEDLVVGAPGVDLTAQGKVGRVYLLSGKTGAIVGGTYTGSLDGDQLGWSVAAVDDLNGDGRKDVIVGVPYEDTNNLDAGAAAVLSMSASGFNLLDMVYGTESGEHFGWDVAGGGDVDGDAKPDFVVGGPDKSQLVSKGGRVSLYSGANRTLIKALDCELPGAKMGSAVHFGGDHNADGFDDFAAGLPYVDLNGGDRGAVRLFSGRDRLLMGQAAGEAANNRFGTDVLIAPDLDALPGADLVVGAPGWSSGKGKVHVYSGVNWQTYSFCTSKPASLPNCVPSLTADSNVVHKSGAPANDLVASPVPGGASLPGILIYTKSGVLPNPANTVFGALCLSSLQRAGAFPASAGGSAGTCNGSYTWNIAAVAAATPSIKVGDALYFQGWYRDPPSAGGANFTHGVGVILVAP